MLVRRRELDAHALGTMDKRLTSVEGSVKMAVTDMRKEVAEAGRKAGERIDGVARRVEDVDARVGQIAQSVDAIRSETSATREAVDQKIASAKPDLSEVYARMDEIVAQVRETGEARVETPKRAFHFEIKRNSDGRISSVEAYEVDHDGPSLADVAAEIERINKMMGTKRYTQKMRDRYAELLRIQEATIRG